jgi:hypothetical protein
VTLTLRNGDKKTGYHNIVRNNKFWNNKGLVFWKKKGGGPGLSDGNGFIIDESFTVYDGRTLITDNLAVNNGGAGIITYKTKHVDIVNNTAYLNQAINKKKFADISCTYSEDCHVFNNIAYTRPAAEGAIVNKVYGAGPNSTYDYNIYFNGQVNYKGPNDIVADPLFVNPGLDLNDPYVNFSLKYGSPAIDSGSIVNGVTSVNDIRGVSRPKGSGLDRGAFEYNVLPRIVSALTASGKAKTAFSYKIVAYNYPNSYDALGLPAGLVVNKTTGIISGTLPAVAGTYNIALSATSKVGTGTSTLVLKVTP